MVYSKCILLTVAAVSIISTSVAPAQRTRKTRETLPDNTTVQPLSADINQLSLNLYKEMTSDGENAFFSPLSISTAFALAEQGAGGETAEEMRKALCLSMPAEQTAEMYGALMNSLNERQKEGAFKLHIANALWVQKGYDIKDSYVDTANRSFHAEAEELSFQTKAEEAAARINAWVAQKTADKIKQLISPDAINALTRLVLTNAVYFKGAWHHQFAKRVTRPKDFYLPGGESVKIDTMHQTDRFGYNETDAAQVLQMPYRKCGLAMVIVLPKEKDGLEALEASLNPDTFAELTSKLQSRRVQAALPKFKMETKYNLNKSMQALGMKKAFDKAAADFSGITGKEKLFIQAAVHKAYIDVDEKGTEAAAATGLMIQATSAEVQPPTPYVADHPFMFLIRDTRTGVILFIGRVLDPR